MGMTDLSQRRSPMKTMLTILSLATALHGASAMAQTGHVAANGINYYYEVHGKGEPLLLLHGGLGSIDMFRPVLPALSKGRRVIAVDLQGHGRTELGARPVSLVDMGDDMAVILKQLGVGQVDVLG
jgi:pimeloyl-ACP methyl ester carboxylesterase